MPRSRRIDPDVEYDRDEDETPIRRRTRRAASAGDDDPYPKTMGDDGTDGYPEDDEEQDEDVAPPRRRRRANDAPIEGRGNRRRSEPEDEAEDENDDDEDAAIIPIHRGRKEIRKNRPVGEGGDAYFRWEEEPQVVKFLSNEPWSYDQHWVTRDGKQSFPCLGKGCPLCAIGAKVAQKVVYPVLNLTHKKGMVVQSLEVGITLDETLATHDADKRTGPLTRLWWSLSRTEGARSSGRRAKYNYVITPVKDRDLEEDWEIDLDEAEAAVEDAEIPTPVEVLGKWTRASLQEIADEAMGH